MSLQGSLETIALPDVLALLASSSKTGELRISGRIDGQLWLLDGKLIASRVGPEPGHVEAVFQLLRLPRGEFLFEEGSAPPEPGEPCSVDSVVGQATERLAEWRIIEAAIPSLDAGARLRRDVSGSVVTLPADQWRMVVSVAGGTSVRAVLEDLSLGEFDGCRLLKELIDGGLVAIEVAPVRLSAVVSERFGAEVNEAPAVRRRPAPLGVAPPGGAVEQNGRPVPAPTPVNAGPSAAAASAVVALQTTSVRPRPAPLAASPLQEAVAAALEASPPDSRVTARQVDPNRARRPRRVAATRDDVLAEPRRQVGPAPVAAPVSAEVATVPEPEDKGPGEEPINRGLLLKFLSSVRT